MPLLQYFQSEENSIVLYLGGGKGRKEQHTIHVPAVSNTHDAISFYSLNILWLTHLKREREKRRILAASFVSFPLTVCCLHIVADLMGRECMVPRVVGRTINPLQHSRNQKNTHFAAEYFCLSARWPILGVFPVLWSNRVLWTHTRDQSPACFWKMKALQKPTDLLWTVL